MIFASSNCSSKNNIKEAVLELVDYGFKNIELSGGTNYYSKMLEDLLELKDKHQLNYRLHNYFPPPEKHFVLNLASKNENILNNSRDMVKKAVDMSKEFNSGKFGLHAGFRISPRVDQLGKKIENMELLPYSEALESFALEVAALSGYAKKQGIELYLENNVFSKANSESYKMLNPFFLTTSDELFELRGKCNFSFLLDIAHLKVSSKTLNRDFQQEFQKLILESDYIHVSDNDGNSDNNNELKKDSLMYKYLKESDLKNKTLTVEVYDGLDAVLRTVNLLSELQ